MVTLARVPPDCSWETLKSIIRSFQRRHAARWMGSIDQDGPNPTSRLEVGCRIEWARAVMKEEKSFFFWFEMGAKEREVHSVCG